MLYTRRNTHKAGIRMYIRKMSCDSYKNKNTQGIHATVTRIKTNRIYMVHMTHASIGTVRKHMIHVKYTSIYII